MSDKQPYFYDEQAERGLVASVVAAGDRALDEVGMVIRPEHLFLQHYRLIYLACFDLYAAGHGVNLVSVTHQLRTNDDLERVGGPSFVSILQHEGLGAQSAMLYAGTILHKERIRRTIGVLDWAKVELPQTRDYNFFDELESRVLDLAGNAPDENRVPVAIENIKTELDRLRKGEKTAGFTTGVPSWDFALRGIVPGRYYALAARPGLGKTSMAEQAVAHMLDEGRSILFFSQDMSAEMLLKRSACRITGTNYKDYEHGQIRETGRLDAIESAVDKFGRQNLFVLSPSKLTGESLRSTVRTYKRRHNIDCVFLDHIQLLDVGKDMREGLTKASIQIRQSATQSGVAHIILAHLNRDAKDNERPRASDIKEFDQLFGDCDVLILLWSAMKQFENNRIIATFTVAKNRYGPVCEDRMSFYGPTMRFDHASKHNEPEKPNDNRFGPQ